MAEYEDQSVTESGAIKTLTGLAVKLAKFFDYIGSFGAAAASTGIAGASWLGGWLKYIVTFGYAGTSASASLSETAKTMFTNGNTVAAGVVGVARGIEATSELLKGHKLKAANLTIKGAVEAGVVFAELGTLGMASLLLEPISFIATGKALSTNIADAVVKVVENAEESMINRGAKKRAEAKKTELAGSVQAQPSLAQQAAPIMMVPMMMAQNMQPAMLPSQPVIQPQMMPYNIQQVVENPSGMAKPANYWTTYVTQNKPQQQTAVAAVPQEAAAFSHAVNVAEQKMQSATAQQTV